MQLRHALFDWSRPIHHDDVGNGFHRGVVIHRAGVLETYDKMARDEINVDQLGLDYAPLRLTAVGMWAGWFESHFPGQNWDGSYEDTWPMLTANTFAEGLSSVLIFLIVRLWWIRSHVQHSRATFHAAFVGFAGGMLFWFNPAILWDAHCWPQWDVWPVPFFLGAVLLTCTEWWFFAAACVLCGAFFKGQILLVAPLFVLWPLFQGRPWPAVRFACGAVAAGALLAWPWMIHDWFAEPNSHLGGFLWIGCTFTLLATVLLFARRYRQLLLPIFSAVAGVSIFMLMPLFGASDAWFTFGFQYGSRKFPMLASAFGTYSIPTLLRDVFGWSNDMEALAPIPGPAMSTRVLMLALYGMTLLLCSIGAAVNDRRRDARFLVAVVAPWLCFFSLLTQMNNRYLVWTAGLSALLIGVDIGLSLLGFLLSLICVIGMAQHMLPMDPSFAPDAMRYILPLRTHLAWPVALAAGVYIYYAIKPGRRRESREQQHQ